ncbi:MAG TPA: sigma-70 family RNA polymerase sigma factor [Candidatus Saccharimonadales bacterium]|nr:sigma-70 family RNA polymerase sigma factor [Candidatus Saccharimonadales bacterium]
MTEKRKYTEEEQDEQFRVTNEHIKQMRDGDPNIWEEVISHLNPKLLPIAGRMVGRDDADDRVNDTWIKLLKKFREPDCDVTADGFMGYAAVTLRRTCIDTLRRERPVANDTLFFDERPSGEMSPDELTITKITVDETIRTITDRLGEKGGKDAVQVLLYQAAGFGTKDIATAQKTNENTVKGRALRGRRAARG